MNRRAFTLLELVLVLATMVILAGIAAPRYAASMNRYRADLAARRLAADFGLAQASARAASASRTVIFRPASNVYAITAIAPLTAGASEYAVSLYAAPYNAAFGTITFSDGNNDNQIVFDGFGAPDSGATIQITSGGAIRTVVLDAATGAATVQ